MKMRKIIAVLAAALMLFSILPVAAFAADTYELATSITVGDTVVLTCTSKSMELGSMASKYGNGVAYTTAPVGAYALTVEAGASDGTYAFKTPDGVYLSWSSSNTLITATSVSANSSWTVTFDSNNAIILNAKDSSRKLQWNANSPRFACYTSSQTAVQLYKLSTGGSSEPDCDHVWVDADCTTPKTCSVCGATEGEAMGHSYGEATETVAPDCTNAGEKQSTCSVCGDVKTEAVAALGHTYVDGACTVCGETQPNEVKYTFSDYDAGTQYAENEEHKLDDVVTVTTTDCHFTTQLRIYSSSSNNGYAVITSTKPIVSITLNAGNKVDTLNLYYSENATAADATISVTSTSYKDYTVEIPGGTQYIKLDVAGTQQIRIASMTLSFASAAASDCEHDYVGVETQAPTCSAEGVMTYTCSKCEESYTEAIATIPHNYVEDVIDSTCTTTGTKTYECSVCFDSYDEVIPVKPHNYVDDVCADCGHVKAYKGTIDFSNAEQRTELTTQIQIWTNEDLTFTNNKLTGNNIADYTDPVRIYKNSGIVIEFPEMAKLIIDASGVGNDYLWDATLEAAGLSFTVESKIYTITFAEAVNSLELTCANQVRANSITAIAAHECAYDNAYDTDCNVCGDVREVELPIVSIGASVSEDVSGLAVKFEAAVSGLGTLEGTTNVADYTNATIGGYELISMGAIASNEYNSTLDIPCVYLCDLGEDSAAYAIRIINIPEDYYGDNITFQSYFEVEIDGIATIFYGASVVNNYAAVLG